MNYSYRRILSKTSLKSSSSTTEKSLCPSEEASKLLSEVEVLKQTIESLKISVESRDAAIGTLAREKEQLYVELKSTQRTNRNLRQQLVDGRDMHSKEKDYLIEEIKRLSKSSFSVLDEYHQNTKQTKSESSQSIQEKLKSKDEVIYNICTKYFKIKSSKEKLQNEVEKLQKRSQQMCESVILLLHENRRNLDSILRKLSKSSSPSPNTKSYLNLLQVNTNLHCENTQLKVCLCVKDYSGKREEKTSQKELSVTKCKSQVTHTSIKPKYKIIQRQPVNLHPDLKLSNSYKLGKSNKFRIVHTKFAPYFRRKRLYYSEPNLTSFPSYLYNITS